MTEAARRSLSMFGVFLHSAVPIISFLVVAAVKFSIENIGCELFLSSMTLVKCKNEVL